MTSFGLGAETLLSADVRIVDGNLDVGQSALTGESLTVEKSTGTVAYSGSAVKRGGATGVVDATGTKTFFGKAVELLQLAKPKLHMEDLCSNSLRRASSIESRGEIP